MTPVRVRGLREVGRGKDAVLVVETVAADRLLAFHIPPAEAGRLARVLGLARCRRSPIYELIGSLAAALGGRVSGAILDARAEGISARLLVAGTGFRGERIEIPCHPADAVALALQSAVPILATEAAIDRATRIDDLGDRWVVRAWLEEVRPADFDARLDPGARSDRAGQ